MVGKVTTIQKMSASRLPALMGYSPWATPNDELDMTIRARKEGVHHYEIQVGEAADWGNDLEHIILRRAAERLGLHNLKLEYPEAYEYKGLLQASLDGGAIANEIEIKTDEKRHIYVMTKSGEITLDGPGVLEAKLTRAGAKEYPEPYRGPIQLQGQMLCTGAQWGVIAILYQGVELYLYVYKAEQDMQQQIIKACSDFERRVRDEDYYPALHAAEAADMHSIADPEKILDADDALAEKIQQLAHIRSELKAYEALERDIQLDIMNAMGDASWCNTQYYKVHWPTRRIKAKPAQLKEIAAVEEHWQRAKTLKVDSV
jgi:predicted phage-related endonuclease